MGKASLIGLLLLVTPAWAQTQPCYPMAQYVSMLADKGQRPASYGRANNGLPIMVFRNPDTYSWTIVMQTSDGFLCKLMEGQGWERRKPQPGHSPT